MSGEVAIGSRISVDSMDGIHRGKVLAIKDGEASVRWNGGAVSNIDVLDLLKPDGSPFEARARGNPNTPDGETE